MHKCWLTFCLAFLVLLESAHAAERLNIVSIVTDDQASWSIGAYGNRESRTPNMDRLAREGALFINAFVATPVCSPSRASFLTGLYGTQVGITDYLAPKEQDAGVGLPPETTTWPEVLQQQGYVTGLLGKWHLGAKPHFHPHRHGFNHFFGFLGGGNRPMDPTLELNGETKQLKGPLPDLLVDNAIQFVEKNRSNPFGLLLHFRAPHLPYGPVPQQDSAPFKDLDPTVPHEPGMDVAQVKEWTRDYYASIHSVDRNLGRLLAKLDELELTGKTIVLFTSDHGYNIGQHGLHTKGNAHWWAGGVRGPKRPNMFETSIRVPLIIRWPGVVKPGTQIPEPVSNIDTFASVLGMLNIPVTQNLKQEGLDFSTLLRGEKIAWRDTLFAQYDLHNVGLAYMRMIRTNKWKLVRHYFANMLDELYDLEKDPEEKKNLYDVPEHAEIRDHLQKRLTEWQQSIRDPILEKQIQPTHAADRPNVVIILADDLGYGDLSCYGSKFKTPNLDRMAAEGARFTDFYTPMPFCAPTRAALLTGRYPFRSGMVFNPAPDSGIDDVGIPDQEIMLGEAFKHSGYATCAIGKWHLGHKPEFYPRKHGFDYYYGILYSNDMRPVQLIENETVVEYPVIQPTLTKRYTQKALQFIEQNRSRPFFLYLPHAMPHKPLSASEDFYMKTPSLYGDVMSELDWSVAQLLAKLKELDLDRNTLVVFTSDNGPWFGGSTAGLRGMKGLTWDGGIRVPMIARWPGRIPAGLVCHEPAGTIDLFTTALTVAGIAIPKDRAIDGKNIWPLMTTRGTKTPHEALFAMKGQNLAIIRSGQWKLHVLPPGERAERGETWIDPRGPDGVTIVAPYEQARPSEYPGVQTGDEPREMMLFDLMADPAEQHDVALRHPEVVKRLKATFDQLKTQVPEFRGLRGAPLKRPGPRPKPEPQAQIRP